MVFDGPKRSRRRLVRSIQLCMPRRNNGNPGTKSKVELHRLVRCLSIVFPLPAESNVRVRVHVSATTQSITLAISLIEIIWGLFVRLYECIEDKSHHVRKKFASAIVWIVKYASLRALQSYFMHIQRICVCELASSSS